LLSSLRDRLDDAGFSKYATETEVAGSDDPSFANGEAAGGHDITLMGETEHRARDRVFGRTYESVAEGTDVPVVVLREGE
jgi:nucleotide-binding universal stress UspA family protein